MIDVKFEINGRKVDPRNMKDAVMGMVIEAATQDIRHKIGSCRCPMHGKYPTVVAKGRDVSKLSLEVSGCCDRLIEDVKHRLA
jgi:hypothetical protein